MAGEKNFIIKNGLTVGTTEVIDSSGNITAAAMASAVNEGIDDQVNSLIVGGTGFIGKHLALKAVDNGYKTSVVSLNQVDRHQRIKNVEYHN